ncbi:MAG: ABC transporter permease, partial [Flavisolibacter sp.]|nr:ABC transporter permease [Flavisolibacter sp.]
MNPSNSNSFSDLSSPTGGQGALFINYFKIAFRNLWKNKGYSAINIFGLAVGLATCLLITLYILDELSYDKYNVNADRIYRVDADLKFGGDLQKLAVAPDPLAFTVVREYPQVENAVRFRNYGSSVIKKGNQNIKEERIIFTDSTLFDVFTLPMLAGNPKKALAEPNTVVITESIAKKYFGTTNVLGQTLLFDNKDNYKITGIIKDVPENSHFNFDFFVALAGVKEANQNIWVSFNFNTYLLFKDGVNAKAFEKKFEELLSKYIFPQAQQIMQISPEDFERSGNYIHFSLTPL